MKANPISARWKPARKPRAAPSCSRNTGNRSMESWWRCRISAMSGPSQKRSGWRIWAVGARPAAFNTVRYSEKILESAGISVETLDLSEVLGRIGRLKDDDKKVTE